MSAGSVEAILLAAGASERMGRNKLLMPIDCRTIFEISLDHHLGSSLSGVCAVVPGWIDAFKEVIGRAARPRVTFLEIERPCEMSESLKAGWVWLMKHTASRGIMVSLADKPLVGPRTIDLLIEAYLASDKAFCVPTHRGRRGHPVIIGRELDGDVMRLEGDRGARDLLAATPGGVLEVEVEGDEVLIDLDRVEDFELVRSRLGSHG
jgi:molybdenum cofactor cytidylyltransferase